MMDEESVPFLYYRIKEARDAGRSEEEFQKYLAECLENQRIQELKKVEELKSRGFNRRREKPDY